MQETAEGPEDTGPTGPVAPGRLSDRDLDAAIERGRRLVADQAADHGQSADHAVGSEPAADLGAALVERAGRLLGTGAAAGAEAAFAQWRPEAYAETLRRTPELLRDLDEAITVLTRAMGLEDHTGARFARLAGQLGPARILRHHANGLDGADADLREADRILRIVLDHPRSSPADRDRCADILMFVLVRRVLRPGMDLTSLRSGALADPAAGTAPAPSQEADLDILTGLVRRFMATRGQSGDPLLAPALAMLAGMRGNGMSDQALGDFLGRREHVLAQLATQPLFKAIMSVAFAGVGEALTQRRSVPEPADSEVIEPPQKVCGSLPPDTAEA